MSRLPDSASIPGFFPEFYQVRMATGARGAPWPVRATRRGSLEARIVRDVMVEHNTFCKLLFFIG
jgi:hypothetical protein